MIGWLDISFVVRLLQFLFLVFRMSVVVFL